MDATRADEYGLRLRELRKRAGLRTQKDLAAAAGLHRVTVARIEAMEPGDWSHAKQRLHSALRERISFSEPWLVYGIGSWDQSQPGEGAAALERYLAGPLAVGIRAEVREVMLRIPWDSLGVPHWSQEAIHVFRMGVETQLASR
jgi:transcriptional regulator with XRE-family HTH domain